MAITVGGCLWTVAFIAAHEGGFIVTFPEISDLATRSETAEAVKGIAEDSLISYLASFADDPAAVTAMRAAGQRATIKQSMRSWDIDQELPPADIY